VPGLYSASGGPLLGLSPIADERGDFLVVEFAINCMDESIH
jgi:hypothetical protein